MSKILSHNSKDVCQNYLQLNHQYRGLTDVYKDDVFKLTKSLEKTHSAWKKSLIENRRLSGVVAHLERKNSNLENEFKTAINDNRALKAELEIARQQVDHLEIENSEYKRRFEHAGSLVVANLEQSTTGAANQTSVLHLNSTGTRRPLEEKSLQYIDQTGEDDSPPLSPANTGSEIVPDEIGWRQNRSYRRSQRKQHRSSSHQPPAKRTSNRRRHGEADIVHEEELDNRIENQPTPPKQLKRGHGQNSSQQQHHYADHHPNELSSPARQKRSTKTPVAITVETRRTHVKRSVSESGMRPNKQRLDDIFRSPNLAGFGNGWNRGRKFAECLHNFTQFSMGRSVFSSITSSCCVCNKSFGFNLKGYSCADCKITVHDNCRANAPMPCVPMVTTPRSASRLNKNRLADYCPELPPKIPGQLVRCVVALERNCLNTVGLYRVPGSDSEVNKLKENFRTRYPPKLEQFDPETITGYITKFLRELNEPLIPLTSYKEVRTAVERNDEELLRCAIEDLPLPNRDTLAFMCAHLQRVAMCSNENQMPLENLSKVLGPAVVGATSKLAPLAQPNAQNNTTVQFENQIREAERQNQILLCLLKLDHQYWVDFCENPSGTQASNTPLHSLVRRQPSNPTPKKWQPVAGSSKTMTLNFASSSDENMLGPIATPSPNAGPLVKPINNKRRKPKAVLGNLY